MSPWKQTCIAAMTDVVGSHNPGSDSSEDILRKKIIKIRERKV